MWNEQEITVVYPEGVEKLLKKLFAAAWVRIPDNPFDAAREVEQEFGKAHYIATRWVEDEEVLQEKARLIAELGPLAKVPTKEEFAAEIYKEAGKTKTATERLSYYQFFAKVMNYVDSNVNVKVGGDPNNPIEHRHLIRELSDDELARIATSGGNGTAKA